MEFSSIKLSIFLIKSLKNSFPPICLNSSIFSSPILPFNSHINSFNLSSDKLFFSISFKINFIFFIFLYFQNHFLLILLVYQKKQVYIYATNL